jgi:hypothetical protein
MHYAWGGTPLPKRLDRTLVEQSLPSAFLDGDRYYPSRSHVQLQDENAGACEMPRASLRRLNWTWRRKELRLWSISGDDARSYGEEQ